MKRPLLISALFLALAAVLAIYLWPREAAVVIAAARPQPAAKPAPSAESPPARDIPTPKATLSGLVLRNGTPTPNATIVVRADDVRETTTGPDGRYQLDVEALAQFYVSARAGKEASDVAGPFMLGAGEQLGVDLSLWPGATVSGVVVDESRRTPIAKARLVSSAGTVTADAQGRFTIGPVPGRISWLQISADGYFPRLEWLSLTAAREQSGLELSLVPLAIVKGVVTENGQPAPNALVWAEGASSAERTRSCPAVRSATDGTFTVECPEGRWTLNATGASGNGSVSRTLWLTEFERHENVVLELAPTSQVVGQVLRGGQGVPNALLTLVDARTHVSGASTYADTSGAFRFSGVTVSEWLLQVHTGTGASVAGPFELSPPPEITRWNVDLPEDLRLTGRVEPPAQGVVIQVLTSDGLGLPAQTMTDEKGAFTVDPAPRGDLQVEAQGPKGSARRRAKAGDTVVLTLEKATLAVEALDGAGKPLADFTVGMQPSPVGPARRVRVLSPTGEYQTDVSPGAWDVWVEERAGASARVPVTVTSGRNDVRIAMPKTALLTGSVHDAENGRPLSGVEISRAEWNRVRIGITAADGSFSVNEPLDSALLLRAEGYQARYVPLRGKDFDARRPLDIRLKRGADDSPIAPYEGVGMVLLDQPPQVVVREVFTGSPAELSGVRANDVLLLIDGVPARAPAQKNVIPLIMGRAGTTVVITVQRGNEQLQFALRRGLIRF